MKTEGVKKFIMKSNKSNCFTDRTEDALFESRLITRMLFKSGINSNNFSLDVVSGNVYIIGLADDLEEKQLLKDSFRKWMILKIDNNNKYKKKDEKI